MDVGIFMQDPTDPETTYLYEAILRAVVEARAWHGLYAFATKDGIDHLIDDRVVQDMMNDGGEIGLVVGVDSVTNRAALERMQELEECYANFRARVFWNETSGLFHPKISDFVIPDGGRILIVGSGNLTPGGLRGNFEGYTVIRTDRGDDLDVDVIERFLERHVARIRKIDEEVLERAAQNTISPGAGARRRASTPGRRHPPSGIADLRPGVLPTPPRGRILVAQVPGAGGRWTQVHLNAHVVKTYFRLSRLETERVYLTRVLADATRGELEIRPCVYSEGSNRNYKIEIGAAKGLDYPVVGRPILIFRERQLRVYDYMLIMPGDEGHTRILELSNRLPSPGRGLPRPVTDTSALARAWRDCPLLQVAEAPDEHV